VNGEVLAAIIGLSLNSLAWPVLFAFRRVSFTAWPARPAEASQIVPAADGTGPSAAGAATPPPLKPSLRGPAGTGAGL
jgi:hypothetical protein